MSCTRVPVGFVLTTPGGGAASREWQCPPGYVISDLEVTWSPAGTGVRWSASEGQRTTGVSGSESAIPAPDIAAPSIVSSQIAMAAPALAGAGGFLEAQMRWERIESAKLTAIQLTDDGTPFALSMLHVSAVIVPCTP